MSPVLVDSAFLVSLYRPSERAHPAAWRYLAAHRHPLATVAAVVAETCYFLPPAAKVRLLSWIRAGAAQVFEVPVSAYSHLEGTLAKYADHDIDFADAALVWLANQTGMRAILTADEDFAILRLKGNRRFELIDWRPGLR